jgi:hypothetical protein
MAWITPQHRTGMQRSAAAQFHHVALVPAEAVDGAAAAVVFAIAALAAAAAVRLFERRDPIGT